MAHSLFDANCGLGRWATAPFDVPTTPNDLEAALDAAGIGRALVYPLDGMTDDPWHADLRLAQALSGSVRLSPCWVVAPHQTGEFPAPAALCGAMGEAGVRAARLFPREQGVALRAWHVGDLCAALEALRAPLFLDFGQEHWNNDYTDWDGVYGLCTAYPRLPVVLVRADVAGSRRLFALMQRCPNLYIETSYYTVHRGIEALCGAAGAERVLFGSGLPSKDAGPALTALAYAGLSADDAALVGGGNLDRLLAEVAL